MRIQAGPDPSKDLGEHMPYLGRVQRFYRPSHPDHLDRDVHAYIHTRGETMDDYQHYRVAASTLENATISISRYNRPSDPLSAKVKQYYTTAAGWMQRVLAPHLSNSDMATYSQVIEWLAPKKSSGYPWNLEFQYKEDYYGTEFGESFWAKYWEKLATDDYIRSLAAIVVKKEVRSSEKLDRGSVRTISAMDVNHTIAILMFCLLMFQRLIYTHLRHFSALGTVPLYGGWHKLGVGRDAKFNFRAATLELDGVAFDRSLLEFVLNLIRDVVWSFLAKEHRTEDNWVRFKNLFYEIIHCPLVNLNGDVYGRSVGNTSGNGITSLINTLKNFLDCAVLWMIITEGNSGFFHNYDAFTRYVDLVLNGDDNNTTVDPDIHHLFNVESIRAAAPEISMEYTFASEQYRLFTECEFLGHGFRLVNVPRLGHAMYLPVGPCNKMRTNMLIFNESGTPANTIVRACGLRNETFGCADCREWFADLIEYLREKYQRSRDPEIVAAWKNYLSDQEIWEIYTGHTAEDVRTSPASM